MVTSETTGSLKFEWGGDDTGFTITGSFDGNNNETLTSHDVRSYTEVTPNTISRILAFITGGGKEGWKDPHGFSKKLTPDTPISGTSHFDEHML